MIQVLLLFWISLPNVIVQLHCSDFKVSTYLNEEKVNPTGNWFLQKKISSFRFHIKIEDVLSKKWDFQFSGIFIFSDFFYDKLFLDSFLSVWFSSAEGEYLRTWATIMFSHYQCIQLNNRNFLRLWLVISAN